MNLNEQDIKATGHVEIVVTDKQGKIKETRSVKNLVMTVGKAYIAQRMTSGSTQIMNTMAIGVGTTTPAATQTALSSEAGRVATSSFSAGGTSGNEVTATATFPAGTGTGSITEAGIFNPSSAGAAAGTMMCRTTFPVVSKAAGDSIAITWKVTVS
jgi:hypothetical protein